MTQQPRRARRTDRNQDEIVECFEKLGFSVIRINGAFDLLVSCGGPSWPIEVKDGSNPPSLRKLTSSERLLQSTYKGRIEIIKSTEEAERFAKGARMLYNALLAVGIGTEAPEEIKAR